MYNSLNWCAWYTYFLLKQTKACNVHAIKLQFETYFLGQYTDNLWF